MISNYAPLLELYSFILMPLTWSGGQRAKRAGGRTIVQDENELKEKQDSPRGSWLAYH